MSEELKEQKQICPKCGYGNPNDATRCETCGYALNNDIIAKKTEEISNQTYKLYFCISVFGIAILLLITILSKCGILFPNSSFAKIPSEFLGLLFAILIAVIIVTLIAKLYMCNKMIDEDKICVIDNKGICVKCIYGHTKPFKIYPIGIIGNNLSRKNKGFGVKGSKELSCIQLLPSQKPFMYKLEEEKFLTVIYYLHETKFVKSIFKRGLDKKVVGVFASRTPNRLSKIAVTEVELIKVEGTRLYVRGLDAINGSPVLDIKLGRKTIE